MNALLLDTLVIGPGIRSHTVKPVGLGKPGYRNTEG